MSTCRQNRALIAARETKGYNRTQLAARVRAAGRQLGLSAPELDTIYKQLYRLESGQTARPGGDFYLPAICAALDCSPMDLFAEPVLTQSKGNAELTVTSHKFIPVYVGADVSGQLTSDPAFVDGTCEWLPGRTTTLSLGLGSSCAITVFDFGVLVAHIAEECQFNSLAELAVWRRCSYPETRQHLFERLNERWAEITAKPDYVLSTYWLSEPHWAGEALDTAMRILCSPAALLERQEGLTEDELLITAEAAERACFREGFSHPEIEQFGMTGVAIGYASWSGVSYLPLAPRRAVTPEEMVTFETVIQALWCYTNMIATVIEDGRDPVVPAEYSWRFLRGCHSRLTSARPRETGQHRMMRDAILSTSRLPAQLLDAHTVLRDLDHLVGRR